MLPAHQRFWWRTRVDWLMRQVRKRELSLNVDGPMLCRIGRSVYHLLSIVGIWANKTLIDAYLDKLRGALTALGCRP